ncbi:MAG: endonuclease III [Syntrophomonadaceae bacterium]|nr:endonuclease III [Syntrophomonadaceae bacterium]
MNRRRVQKILDILREAYPQAGTRLKYQNPFQFLIAVVLSAQSTDEQVNQVTRELFGKYSTPQQMAAMPLEELEELIKGVGLYRNKARHIKELSGLLVQKYGGAVPREFDELIKLPGVGRKSANVVMAVAFGLPGLGVDTHVHRVSNRLGLVDTKQPHKTEAALKALIPRKRWIEAHHLLISHGRAVCKARAPQCASCPLEAICPKNIDR